MFSWDKIQYSTMFLFLPLPLSLPFSLLLSFLLFIFILFSSNIINALPYQEGIVKPGAGGLFCQEGNRICALLWLNEYLYLSFPFSLWSKLLKRKEKKINPTLKFIKYSVNNPFTVRVALHLLKKYDGTFLCL